MNNYCNKSNINFSKTLKNKISNIKKHNYNYFPLINSSREHRNRNSVKKSTSSILYYKRHNSIDDNEKKRRIFLRKSRFNENYFKLLISPRNIKKNTNINLTDFNNDLNNNALKNHKDLPEKNIYLRSNEEKFINEKAYIDKITELNNHNIDKAIKEIFMH